MGAPAVREQHRYAWGDQAEARRGTHRVQRTDNLQMNVSRDFWVKDSGLRGWGYGQEWRQ